MHTAAPKLEVKSLARDGRSRPVPAMAHAFSKVDPRWPLYAVYFGESWVLARLYWRLTQQLDVANLWSMVAGTAEAPFIYRPLMPWVMRVVPRLSGVNDLVLVDIGLRVLVMFGAMLVLRRWLRHFAEPVMADICPLLLVAILPGTLDWYWMYDFSGILLWTAALVALVERRYALYLLLLVIGTLNRETAALLVGMFAVTQWDALGARRALRWTAVQAALFAAVWVGLRLLIHPIGGETVEIHWSENVAFLLGRNHINGFENWMGMLGAMGFLWLLAPWRWRNRSMFLRRTCWLLPAYALVIFVTGRLAEPRLWNEWIPVVMALACQNLTELARREQDQLALSDCQSKQPS